MVCYLIATLPTATGQIFEEGTGNTHQKELYIAVQTHKHLNSFIFVRNFIFIAI
jgi:hypothetical protein